MFVSKKKGNRVPSKLMSVAEACEYLGVSKTYLYDLMFRGQLNVVMLGRRRMIPESEVHAIASGERDVNK